MTAIGEPPDRRRIATRDDHSGHTYFSAICIAASVAFCLD
jgi:hypothetical protein